MRPRLIVLACILLCLLAWLAASPAQANTSKVQTDWLGRPTTPVTTWRTSWCTWYGPGFYWHHTASGRILLPPGRPYRLRFLAHPSRYSYWGAAVFASGQQLRLGSLVELSYGGCRKTVRIDDRGGGAPGFQFDLAGATKTWFDFHGAPFNGCQRVTWRVVRLK